MNQLSVWSRTQQVVKNLNKLLTGLFPRAAFPLHYMGSRALPPMRHSTRSEGKVPQRIPAISGFKRFLTEVNFILFSC